MSQWQWTRDFREVEAEMWEIARAFTSARPEIALEWNGRFTRRMGDATTRADGTNRIRLSKPLWPHATPEKRRNTAIHELAHIYAYVVDKGRGHGREWKRWMRRFGEQPERCYSLTEENFHDLQAVKGMKRKTKKWGLTCPGCNTVHEIGSRMRNTWIRKRQIRGCTKCGTKLLPHLAQNARERK